MSSRLYHHFFTKPFQHQIPYTVQETLELLQQYADDPNHGLSRWQRMRFRRVKVQIKFSGHNPYRFELRQNFGNLGEIVIVGTISEQKDRTVLSGKATISPHLLFFVTIVFVIWILYWLLNSQPILASAGILLVFGLLLLRTYLFHVYNKRIAILLTTKRKSKSKNIS